jgi:Xaa-Pro aminopeptidase
MPVPRLIFASTETSADILYATGFKVPDPFLYLERNGKSTILISDLEIGRAKREAKVDEVASLSELEKLLESDLKKKPTIEQTVAFFLRRRRIRRVSVPYEFPVGLATKLAAAGIRVDPASRMFFEAREFKSPAELKLIQAAIGITEAGLFRAIEVLKASEIKPANRLVWAGKTLTSELLRAEIDTAILRAGGRPKDSIVAGGNQACDPHELGSGPLKANSLIILDIFPRDSSTSYFGDLTRTVVRGRASEAQRNLWNTVLEGQEVALRKIRPGGDGAALQAEILELFRQKGYPMEIRAGSWVGFFHGLGHGIGLEIHEQPRIAKTKFKIGQVLTVEPGLYYPGIGGVRIEDDGVVTEAGFKVLSKFPKQLEV